MDALQFYAILFIVIWVLALLFRDQLKIDVNGPLLMRRTTRLKDFIDSIAQKSPRFWRWSMNIGIPVAVFFAGLMVYLLIWSIQIMIQTPIASPILPGVDYPGNPIYIPLGYGLIALATVLVIHEFAHGILARTDGIEIKSIGLLLLAVLPGAFVEPDEEGVAKASKLTKLRIYVAGSIANLTLAGVAFAIFYLISSFFVPAAFHSDGMEIVSVLQNSPANGVLTQGMVIQDINGYKINNLTDYTAAVGNIKIGDTLTIVTDKGTFKIKTSVNPNNSTRAYIGIRAQEHLIVNKNIHDVYGDILPWTLYSLKDLFYWIFLLNFAVGTFNLLPLKPLDGGLVFEELLSARISENKVSSITSNFKGFLRRKLKLSEEKAKGLTSSLTKILSFKISDEKVNTIVMSISWIGWTFLAVNIIYAVGRGILLSI